MLSIVEDWHTAKRCVHPGKGPLPGAFILVHHACTSSLGHKDHSVLFQGNSMRTEAEKVEVLARARVTWEQPRAPPSFPFRHINTAKFEGP